MCVRPGTARGRRPVTSTMRFALPSAESTRKRRHGWWPSTDRKRSAWRSASWPAAKSMSGFGFTPPTASGAMARPCCASRVRRWPLTSRRCRWWCAPPLPGPRAPRFDLGAPARLTTTTLLTSAPMATSVSRVVGLVMVAAVVVATLNACTPKPNGPEPIAEKFFAALASGDTAAAAELSDKPADARATLNEAWAGLQALRLDDQILGSKYAEDTGSVTYRYTWHLPKNRTWIYDGQLNMVREEGRWEVRWSATGLHPRLGEHQTFALRADMPRRASVNERGGTDVLVPGNLYHYTLDAKSAGGALMPTARAVVDALRPFDNTLDPQRLAEQASSSKDPLSLITLRQSDHDRVAGAIGVLPGVVVTPQAELLPTDDSFAPDIVSQVKNSVVDELDGDAGWRVVSVNQNGADVDVLNEVPGAPAPSVSISLDRAVQNAAQGAVNTTGKKAMIVVIKPSTGEILAVAQNAAADSEGPVATTGLYPPGSTFKIITAGAAIDHDMATPNTLLACPGTIATGNRTIPNYGGNDYAAVPSCRAVARSCNTTLAQLTP